MARTMTGEATCCICGDPARDDDGGRPGPDGRSESRYGRIHELVNTALGEASMAWTSPPAGVFDTRRIAEISERLTGDVEEFCYEALAVIANASDWERARPFPGFEPAGLPPRDPDPAAVEWAAAARRWLDGYNRMFGLPAASAQEPS
jgi:hypothetical protein